MASSGSPIGGVGGGVGSHIALGDIVVSRIRGPFEACVIGRIYADSAGDRRCWYLDHADSRENAIRKAYSHRTGEHQVWLFTGPDDQVYSAAPEPPHWPLRIEASIGNEEGTMTENRRCGQCGRPLVYVTTGFEPLGSPEEDPEQLHACPDWHEIWSYAPADGGWRQLDSDDLLDWKRRLLTRAARFLVRGAVGLVCWMCLDALVSALIGLPSRFYGEPTPTMWAVDGSTLIVTVALLGGPGRHWPDWPKLRHKERQPVTKEGCDEGGPYARDVTPAVLTTMTNVPSAASVVGLLGPKLSVGQRLSPDLEPAEASGLEYQILGTIFPGEHIWRVNPQSWLGLVWDARAATVDEIAHKVALERWFSSRDAAVAATGAVVQHMTTTFGEPEQQGPGLFIWDGKDGNVVLQLADAFGERGVSIFVTSITAS